MKRIGFKHVLLGVLIGQLLLLGYIARLSYQARGIAALSYIELVGK